LACKRGHGKALLRELVRRRVPAELVDRPKQGFDVPIVAASCAGPCATGSAICCEHRGSTRPLLDAPGVAARALTARRADYGYALWALAMYRAWYTRHAL
jgi:asparagine synthase (glutamine-hydrolysing)